MEYTIPRQDQLFEERKDVHVLTYEQITSQLIESMYNARLEPYVIREKLEINTLEKEFICQCAPDDHLPPYHTYAEVSFRWESVMTTESVHGGNCHLYHDETAACTHEELVKDTFIELNITYFFEVEEGFEVNTDVINGELMNVFETNMNHDNLPQIKWELTISSDGSNSISSITAHHLWFIEFDDLPIEFEDFLFEVRDVLDSIDQLPFIKKSL